MNYQETLQWMYAQLPMYQREGQAAYKANLDNTIKLDELFNHPHQAFKSIHIAGTNGKGSTSHMLASILQESGYKTGLYTSPHLKDFRERIKINGEVISEEYVTQFIEQHKTFFATISPSFFEMTVAMAFKYFRDMDVDIAVIETGLGGRLDSTNIITPLLTVITNISFDHCALLGNTIEKIAEEKAGIIKSNIPAIIGCRDEKYSLIFEQIAADKKAPIIFASDKWEIEKNSNNCFTAQNMEGVLIDNVSLDLKGNYQIKNIPAVLESAFTLQSMGLAIYEQDILKGLANTVKNTGLLGRWQVLKEKPYTVCDTGHNEAGIKEVVEQIRQYPYSRLHFILGMVNDKEVDTILSLLPMDAIYYFTQASIPRAMDVSILAEKAATKGLRGMNYPTVTLAYEAACQNALTDDMIFIGGSTFTVAEIV